MNLSEQNKWARDYNKKLEGRYPIEICQNTIVEFTWKQKIGFLFGGVLTLKTKIFGAHEFVVFPELGKTEVEVYAQSGSPKLLRYLITKLREDI